MGVSDRAEQIAAHLVGHALGFDLTHFDVGGRQGVVDFRGVAPGSAVVSLEVTLLGDPRAFEWRGLLERDGGVWPAAGRWDYRPASYGASYRRAREACVRIARECDRLGLEGPHLLPPSSQAAGGPGWCEQVDLGARLSRAPWEREPGIHVYPPVRVEVVDPEGHDLSDLLERWRELPHVGPHLRKLRTDHVADERHLFLVITGDRLPASLFTDDFSPPARRPRGFEGLDGLWVWSEFWHRYLALRGGDWAWEAFPQSADE